jgi:transposase
VTDYAAERQTASGGPVRVLAMDEARFGLKVTYRRRWCPRGHRPPWEVRRRYKWLWLYAAVDPITGSSFCLYLPHVDSLCFETFLQRLREAYPDEDLLIVLDGSGAHHSGEVTWPEGVAPLFLPPYSPELNPAERWFEPLRGALSNEVIETMAALDERLTQELRPYWDDPARLARLTGYPWWVASLSETPTL